MDASDRTRDVAMATWLEELRGALDAYLRDRPRDAPRLAGLGERILHAPAGLRSRSCMDGHVTASMLVLDPTGSKALVIHHRGLGRWLQPGGHCDAGETLWETALREAREETGLIDISRVRHGSAAQPLDFDTHPIPARPDRGEGAHLHHDACYLGMAHHPYLLAPQDDEVSGVEWRPLALLAEGPEERVARLARRAIDVVAAVW